MTTVTHGLLTTKAVRGFIVTLEERRAWVAEKLADKIANRPDLQARIAAGEFDVHGTFEGKEIAALTHAIDLMETEWDNLVRLRANVERIEGRNNGVERHLVHTGEEFDPAKVLKQKPLHWDPPNPG